MSERWCNDCAWTYECAAENSCRRREAGELRIAAPSEVADTIDGEMGDPLRHPLSGCFVADGAIIGRCTGIVIHHSGRQSGKTAAQKGWHK